MNGLTQQLIRAVNRREFLRSESVGIGAIALASLLDDDLLTAGTKRVDSANGMQARVPEFAAAAKHVIYLHMVGAPSQLDLFDYKPVLQKHNGEPCPKDLIAGERFAFLKGDPNLMGTWCRFAKHGQSGQEISELLPHIAQMSDEIAVVRSMNTEEFNHGPAQVFMMTGFGRQGRPCLGSWVSYGLGSESHDLPAFVVLVTGQTPGAGTSLWGSGFLPPIYQGVRFRAQGAPVLYAANPPGIDEQTRGGIVDDIRRLNEIQLAESGDPEIAARIAAYELAFRMQSSLPGLMQTAGEPKHVLEMYGARPGEASFANNCLLARRLVERGVRFVQLYDDGWDHHNRINHELPDKCREVDRPIAALLRDLKQRGLLDETLVIFGGEFGRTPMLQGEADDRAGRDHHKHAFTMWLAGGGIKPGISLGKTDDLGYHVVEDPVHVNDLHATILHLLGRDHRKLTYRFQGRDYRLTDVGGNIVDKLLI